MNIVKWLTLEQLVNIFKLIMVNSKLLWYLYSIWYIAEDDRMDFFKNVKSYNLQEIKSLAIIWTGD